MAIRSVCLLSVFLVGQAFVSMSAADSDKPGAEKTICNMAYKIVSPDGKQELGTYRIRASAKNFGQLTEIVESMSLDYRGKPAEMKSIVVYESAKPVRPTRCSPRLFGR